MILSASETNDLKQAPAIEGVLPLFHQRWSPRSFSDREVSLADLKKMLEAARWAPSSFNEQPWRFLVGRRGSDTHKKILSALVAFNQAWAGKAPVLMLGVASTKFRHNGQDNYFALHDLGAAATSLALEATALGLAVHQMAGYDHDAARTAFAIPGEFATGSVIALGYQGDPEALGDERLIRMETAPRERKPLGEIALSSWGEPAHLG